MNNKNFAKRYFCVILLVSSFLVFSTILTGCSKKEPAAINNDVKIVVLDDCSAGSDTDEQSKTDEVLLLDSKGQLLKKISGFRVKTDLDISKAISVSPSGRYFAVCENAINKL